MNSKLIIFFSFFFFLAFLPAQAGIVEPVYKQLKDPGTDNEPSTVSVSITPNGKKMFVLDHLKYEIRL